ncbi:maleylpyruvate isomerase N-terminal domain-containing protein [Nocardioides sp. S-58]|uniref:Maleylpyruvate isomerase N-terminal domain-containing protein n=1 Tax=Nocardioides renjunii TaxID=3095075 RepID=A0ABU5K675_9ACTN|nr:maleylpyruvate isomerase N-terminal domain-containing protein [Nocardioides sp. S-58]MDZ5660334.1 maleylpyruvate isomerase N-terminal domain-containing protein [Nocardioides sp. S-58]
MARADLTLLDEAYAALRAVVAGLGEDDAWAPTGCAGWAVRDLVWHLHADAVRGLVAAHTPAPGPADRDAVSYWRAWGSDPDADERNRRLTRVEAGLHPFAALRERYLEASAAAARAVGALPPEQVVATQGHTLRAADLASTLAVEATLHHLDLIAHLDGAAAPPAPGTAEARRVVEALLGEELPGWTDERVALVGTGRAAPTAEERARLSDVRLPVFS